MVLAMTPGLAWHISDEGLWVPEAGLAVPGPSRALVPRPQGTEPAQCVVAARTVPRQLPLEGRVRLNLVCGPGPLPSLPLATLFH